MNYLELLANPRKYIDEDGIATDEALDILSEEASTWVSENEGYNSIEYDKLVEAKADYMYEELYKAANYD